MKRFLGITATTLALAAGCGGGGGSQNMDGGPMGGGDGNMTTLASPAHVAPGADLATADGTEAHPYPTLYDVVRVVIQQSGWTGQLIVHAGRYDHPDEIIIPTRAKLKVLPGAKFYLGSRASIHAQNDVDIQGEPGNEVLFTWLVEGTHWKALTNFTATSQNNVIKYAIFEHGGEAEFGGSSMRGALSIKQAGGLFAYNVFRLNEGDDGINIRASNSVIEHNDFYDNFNDALDSDTAAPNNGKVEIRFNKFHHNGNDGVDLGEGSTAFIHDNVMWGNGDKGVSVGEGSYPLVQNNLIVGNNTGIGVKDMSEPVFSNNTLYRNSVGVASYEGVAGRGHGKGTFKNGIIWDSVTADVVIVKQGDYPGTSFAYSCIKSGVVLDSLETTAISMPLVGDGLLTAASGCADPMFANPGTVPTPVAMIGTVFELGDFHLKSAAGRWDPATKAYVTTDTTTSPCLDKGDPAAAFSLEPTPNGGRLDLGTYGNSAEASKTPPSS